MAAYTGVVGASAASAVLSMGKSLTAQLVASGDLTPEGVRDILSQLLASGYTPAQIADAVWSKTLP